MRTPDEYREVLAYDPATGELRWKQQLNSRSVVGTLAGTPIHGHWRLNVFGKGHLAHRLIWFMVHGQWPEGQIDHINGIRSDNRIENLRVVTPRMNSQNRRTADKGSKTGFLGVSRNGKGFRAEIKYGGKNHHLGTYRTPEEAHYVYVQAKRIHHEGNTL